MIGSPGMLHCKAEGLGKISYRWFKSDTKDGKPKPVFHGENEWYVINSLAQKHWGYYICHAENQYESAISRRVHISAHLPTSKIKCNAYTALFLMCSGLTIAIYVYNHYAVERPLIKILKQPWSQLIPKGGRFRLLCEAVNSGDEPLQYQWYSSGKPIAGATNQVFIR